MEDSICLDTTNERDCNWLCLVPTATNSSDQNCMATQIGRDIFYITTCHVGAGQQLRVWYAPSYARKLGRPVQPDGKTCSKKSLFGSLCWYEEKFVPLVAMYVKNLKEICCTLVRVGCVRVRVCTSLCQVVDVVFS